MSFLFILEDRNIFFRRDSLFHWSFLFFHFLVFLSFCTVGHRFVVFVFEKPLLFLEIELIRASVMVTFSDQYQLRLTKKHNSFHFEFVLRGLSYDHVNAVPSLLQRFFSLVFIFSKGCMSSRNFPFVFYCTLLLKKVWTF